MGRHDWYRNTTWTREVRDAFFKRLDRSRSSYNKAQYVRIQASCLQETGKKKHILAALDLLDLMFENWPEPSGLAIAHLQRARCFEYLGDYESAINSYRESIKAERKYKTVKVNAALHFGQFVVKRGLSELYDEVLSGFEPCEASMLWPVYQFTYFSVLSIILDHEGETEHSRRFAKIALEAMAKQESPFRYHKKLGLVRNPEKAVVKKLKQIAGL